MGRPSAQPATAPERHRRLQRRMLYLVLGLAACLLTGHLIRSHAARERGHSFLVNPVVHEFRQANTTLCDAAWRTTHETDPVEITFRQQDLAGSLSEWRVARESFEQVLSRSDLRFPDDGVRHLEEISTAAKGVIDADPWVPEGQADLHETRERLMAVRSELAQSFNAFAQQRSASAFASVRAQAFWSWMTIVAALGVSIFINVSVLLPSATLLRDAITERIHLRMRDRWLHATVDSERTPIVVMDPDGCVQWMNKAAVDLAGDQAESGLGQPIRQIFGTPVMQDEWTTVERAVRDRVSAEVQRIEPEHDRFDIQSIRLQAVRDSNSTVMQFIAWLDRGEEHASRTGDSLHYAA